MGVVTRAPSHLCIEYAYNALFGYLLCAAGLMKHVSTLQPYTRRRVQHVTPTYHTKVVLGDVRCVLRALLFEAANARRTIPRHTTRHHLNATINNTMHVRVIMSRAIHEAGRHLMFSPMLPQQACLQHSVEIVHSTSHVTRHTSHVTCRPTKQCSSAARSPGTPCCCTRPTHQSPCSRRVLRHRRT